MRHVRVTVIRSSRDSGQVGGRVDDPVVAPQNTVGEGYIPLTSEPEAEGPADAVRRAVRCRRERMHEPPAAVIAGQLKKHPDSLLREPASLELRQDHPADLGNRLAAILVVGPQHDRPRHHFRCGLAGDDHLYPRVAGRGRLDIAGDLLLDALAGERTAELGHHDRVAPHPHIGADVAQLNIPQTHLLLPAGQSSWSAPASSSGSSHHLRAHRQTGCSGELPAGESGNGFTVARYGAFRRTSGGNRSRRRCVKGAALESCREGAMTGWHIRARSRSAGALLGAIAVLVAGCAAAGGGGPRADGAGAARHSVAASPPGRVFAHRIARTPGPGGVKHGSGSGIVGAGSLAPCALPLGDPVSRAGAASRLRVAVPACLCCRWCAWACCGCRPGRWPPQWRPPRSPLAWLCCPRWLGPPNADSSPRRCWPISTRPWPSSLPPMHRC